MEDFNEAPVGGPSRYWYLEGRARKENRRWRVPIRTLPFRVGRRSDLDLSLRFESISKEHAEIFDRGGELHIRDLGSTNGTFVNGQALKGQAALGRGDVIHFSDQEFTLGFEAKSEAAGLDRTTLVDLDLNRQVAEASQDLPMMIRLARVSPVFQPIVSLADGETVAFEVLIRGNHENLPVGPRDLFDLATHLELEADLGRLFRQVCLKGCEALEGVKEIFLNSHPKELEADDLLPSLAEFHERAPDLKINLEIHETAVTDPERVRVLRDSLRELGMGLAYDDFGAGQARLLELIEVPPDYLKFDISLIHGIHRAPHSRRRILESLLDAVKDLGIVSIAEGIEVVEEAEICTELGFTHAQGFLFGRPVPAEDLFT